MAWAGDEASFQDFIDRHGLTFPTISDDGGEIYARFEVPAQPALVVVDTDGSVQTFLGAVERDDLDATLTAVTS